MLTKRQNLIEVMNGGTPERFVNQYEAFALMMGVPISPYRRTFCGGGPVTDGWGVTKEWPVGTPGAFPLHDDAHLVCKDITRWRDYVKAPSVEAPDSAWEDIVKRSSQINRDEQFALVFLTPGLFETCHNLLGLQECLINFYEEPEHMHELIDYLTEHQLAMAEQICDRLHPDGVFQHDDWGTQISTFISPEMFEEFYVPAYKKIYGYYKSRGAELIVHHSDSYAATLVPYMIDMGIRIWQGVLSTNNIPELIQKYGEKITFMGGIDDGCVDVEGWTPELIRDEVRRACVENGKYYYIPSLLQGLPFSIYPGVHDEVTKCIDEMSKELFQDLLPPKGTDILCRNLVETTYDDLSEENIRIFKDRLLDMTGCILGGDIVPEDRFFYDFLKNQGGLPQAPLFADERHIRLPLTSAVMHNCLHARANDFGNMAMVVFGDPIASHYGETILPMNLTLADVFGCTGKEFIAHNIAAEDTIGRILYTLPVRWPTDMELGSSAAAAIAIRYYQLDAQQAKVAFSYAATNATDPGNAYYDYCQEYKYHNAESARCGIMAVELAKGGWRGLADPFFGNAGLITKKMPPGKLPDLYSQAFDQLGETYFTEVRFKRGPGGMPTIVASELGMKLRQQMIEADGHFDAEKIRQVRILEPDKQRRNYYSNPFTLRNHTNALFSYAFACCCSLYHGDRRVDLVQTPMIQAHPLLIELTENTVIESYSSTAENVIYKAQAEMKDGRCFEVEADFIREMFEYPTREFLEKKFWDQFNAFGKLPKATGEKIIELANRIDTLADMREYTQLLTIN